MRWDGDLTPVAGLPPGPYVAAYPVHFELPGVLERPPE
jgi:hypothetical protein